LFLNLDISEFLEPNIMTVVNTPENWTITDSDIRKLSWNFLPARSFLREFSGTDIISAHDNMSWGHTTNLTVTDTDVDEVSWNFSPSTSGWLISSDRLSEISVTIVSDSPDLSINTN
jgi:hypothetical protein